MNRPCPAGATPGESPRAPARGLAACQPLAEDVDGRLSRVESRPSNVIERGLTLCSGRKEAQEADCVRAALAAEGTSLPELVALMPGCATGRLCHYTFATRDRIGAFLPTAAELVIEWRVEVDLRKAPARTADAPLTVTQI